MGGALRAGAALNVRRTVTLVGRACLPWARIDTQARGAELPTALRSHAVIPALSGRALRVLGHLASRV